MNRSFFLIASLVLLSSVGCGQASEQKTTSTGNGTTTVELVTDLKPAAFKAAIDEGKARLIDVRTPGEYSSGHLAGSVNIDWTGHDYEKAFGELDPKVPVLLYCRSGGRSGQAMEHLRSKGFTVQHLEGGITSWQQAGYPVQQ